MISTTDFYWISVLCINSVALFVLLILLIKNKESRLPNFLGSLTFLICGLFIINNFFLESQIVLKYPHLYQILTPTEYLIPPVFYISIRTHFLRQNLLKKFDWLFFLPVLFQVIDFLPFYLKSAEEKRTIVEQVLNHTGIFPTQDVGYLPPYLHVTLKFIYAFILNVVIWAKFKRYIKGKDKTALTAIEKWSTFSMVAFGIATLSPFFIFFLKDSAITYPYFFTTFFTIIIFGMIVNLALKPELLYGSNLNLSKPETSPYEVNFTSFKNEDFIKEEEIEFELEEVIEQKKFQLEKELLEEYKLRIEKFLKEKKPFLKPGYSLGDLSSDLNIPKHHLSMTFNAEFNVRYNDLLNTYRIEYAKSLILDKSKVHLTLEAIALESGFNSRVTFIRAFTKLVGMSPSDFNKDISV